MHSEHCTFVAVEYKLVYMIYTSQEHEWLSKPTKKKRVSNQTQDGSAPAKKDMRKHDWAITTTIEVNGKHYVVPVQV